MVSDVPDNDVSRSVAFQNLGGKGSRLHEMHHLHEDLDFAARHQLSHEVRWVLLGVYPHALHP